MSGTVVQDSGRADTRGRPALDCTQARVAMSLTPIWRGQENTA